MNFAEHDDMVGALSANGFDQPFGDAVLPDMWLAKRKARLSCLSQ
jgi:hypothetical protein